MKNLAIGFGIIIIALFVFATVSTIEIDSAKEQTLTESVRLSIYQTMNECKDVSKWPVIEQQYAQKDADQVLALRFQENLMKLLQTKDTIEIQVIESDYEAGVLSMTVQQKYRNWGVRRTVQVQETVIYNESTK